MGRPTTFHSNFFNFYKQALTDYSKSSPIFKRYRLVFLAVLLKDFIASLLLCFFTIVNITRIARQKESSLYYREN